jgi:hypothetical protein
MGQMNLGLVVPYSPEYRAGGINLGLLGELARITGGGPLGDPLQAFLHNLPAVNSAREIGRTLLLIAALLFPLDVALRRVMISRRDMALARAWINERLPGRKTAREQGPVLLGQLFSARERARRRTTARVGMKDTPANPESTGAPAAAPRSPSTPDTTGAQSSDQPAAPSPQAGDSFERLREAKKRARKK